MNKILRKSISIASSFLVFTLPFFVFAEAESLNITPTETVEDYSSENIIEEKNGIITINGEIIHYVPDSKIKTGINYTDTGDNVEFVIPEELSSEEIVCQVFPEGSPKPEDVRQGQLGACVFLSTLSGLAENNPDFIKENLIEYNNDFVIVKFFRYQSGYPIYIMVQKTIPDLLTSEGAFLSNNCLWVHMYLKAYVAMELVIRKICDIDYKDAILGRLSQMLWVPATLTGKEMEMGLSCWMEEECIYKKIKETLEMQGIILCNFSDSVLCRLPVFKYFFNKIECKGLFAYHAYSVSQVYEDENGIKWVCCRNPWGYYVPVYDKFGELSVVGDDDNYTEGYFWLKLKDFHKNCDKIYFSTKKNIIDDVKFNKLKIKIPSIQNFN